MDPCSATVVFLGGVAGLVVGLRKRSAAVSEERAPLALPGPGATLAPAETGEIDLPPTPKPPTLPEPTDRIGPYALGRELGCGGMAVVYEAVDAYNGRRCALKLLYPQHARRPKIRARFLDEARLLQGFDNPGLVHVIEVLDDPPAFAMELLQGQTLADRLADPAPIPLEQALRILREALRAAAYFHEHGVVHRDLKPGNLFLTPDGLKIMDFGIAKIADTGRTRTRTFLGTPGFMSPEQVESARNVDARSDLFALGAVLYELIARQPAFTGPTEFAVLNAVLEVRYTPLPEVNGDAPGWLVDVVDRALQLDPAARFPTAQAFLAALEEPPIP